MCSAQIQKLPQSVFKWAKLTQSFYGSLEKLQPDSHLIVAFLQRENQMWKLWDLRESWRSACFPFLLFWLMPVCFHLFYSFLPTLTHTGNTDWDAGGFRCRRKQEDLQQINECLTQIRTQYNRDGAAFAQLKPQPSSSKCQPHTTRHK